MSRRRRRKRHMPKKLAPMLACILIVLAYVAIRELCPQIFASLESMASVGGLREVSGSSAQSSDAEASKESVLSGGGELLQVYFLDVGQGDSELIRIPNGGDTFNMLIDTGEYAYADGLTEYLKELGVETIDVLICSHQHTDHMGCMAGIVENFEVEHLYMPELSDEVAPTTSAYEALLDAISESGTPVSALNTDTEIELPGSAGAEVLAPEADADWDELNNWSGVIRLTYGGVSFMFTGDAETQSENNILKNAQASGLSIECDVLKCGHHGSSTSTGEDFLSAVNPKYAVISCGKDNDYGHPHEETLEALSAGNVTVYRTDENGTILCESDGESLSFTTGLASVEKKAD